MEILNTLWSEGYRPLKIEDLVLPEQYMDDFKRCIEKQDIPHLLFYGPPGGGKTSLAKILTSSNGILQNRRDNLLEINGSAKETRGISYVQDGIEPFLKIPASPPDKLKIVFIDEFDYLTDASFSSLRVVIPKYSAHARFVCTCNYLSKIPDAIQSRLTPYKFEQIPIKFVVNYCENILKNEKIEYSKESVEFIVNGLYPDVRKILNALQKSSMAGKLKVNKDIALTSEKILISSILDITNSIKNNEKHRINKSIGDIVALLKEHEHDLEYRSIYERLFFMKEIPVPARIIVNSYSNSHNNCLIPTMHVMSMVFDMIQSIENYVKAMGK